MLRKHVFVKIFITLLVASSVSACQSSRFGYPFERGRGGEEVPSAEPNPAGPIEITDLPPLDPDEFDGQPQRVRTAAATNVQRPAIVTPAWRTMVGPWKAQDSAGTCKVNLSSTATLDFYKASTSGCANKDLAKVSSWEYRDGEVYLYQSGGTVAARLKGGNQQLDGVLQSSGAALTMSK